MILVSIGYSLYLYMYRHPGSSPSTTPDPMPTGSGSGIVRRQGKGGEKVKEYKENLIDKNNSPIQLISQIKGYFYINPFIAISLAITLFSFVGVPPAIGFFAKQMILSAALDNGYIFMALIAILTSVIGAGYYLNLVKQIFFYKNDYEKSSWPLPLLGQKVKNSVLGQGKKEKLTVLNPENITLSSSLSSSISIITLLLILFVYMPEE
jgi:NADH-ubiquinone oxidoreductase chain 2